MDSFKRNVWAYIHIYMDESDQLCFMSQAVVKSG